LYPDNRVVDRALEDGDAGLVEHGWVEGVEFLSGALEEVQLERG
jgi:hypothetical protein